jgi:hypothetical protein
MRLWATVVCLGIGGGGCVECGNEPSDFVKGAKFLDEIRGYAIAFSVQTVLEQVFTTLCCDRDSNPQAPEQISKSL